MSVSQRLARGLLVGLIVSVVDVATVAGGVQAAEPPAPVDKPVDRPADKPAETATATAATPGAATPAAATPTADSPAAETGPPIDTEALQRQLEEGRKVLDAGRRQQAITDYYDPVIAAYRAHYDAGGKRMFCARTIAESLFYVALAAAKDQRDSEVIDSSWSDAYLMKAYALVELGQVEEARAALEAALALAPQNAQYLAEMGYLMQVQQRYDEAIGYFEQSADAADLASPDEIKEAELTRAWRGKAVALIDLGRLDEAEKLLKQCLKKNRKDAKALNELAYIKQVRAKQKAAK